MTTWTHWMHWLNQRQHRLPEGGLAADRHASLAMLEELRRAEVDVWMMRFFEQPDWQPTREQAWWMQWRLSWATQAAKTLAAGEAQQAISPPVALDPLPVWRWLTIDSWQALGAEHFGLLLDAPGRPPASSDASAN